MQFCRYFKSVESEVARAGGRGRGDHGGVAEDGLDGLPDPNDRQKQQRVPAQKRPERRDGDGAAVGIHGAVEEDEEHREGDLGQEGREPQGEDALQDIEARNAAGRADTQTSPAPPIERGDPEHAQHLRKDY